MNIHKSSEDYLEVILMLKKRIGAVRSIDIANEKSFSKPSVSVAMKKLRENGYISVDEDGYITLLDEGIKIAEKIYEKHTLITNFLTNIGVSEEVAKEDACKIEHDLSEDTFQKLQEFYNKNFNK